jgi:Tfp pilus assembly protein PilE
MHKKFLKGFTLVELITILAIVAVLTGVLIPSASYFIRNAKLKTANSQAKVVFNAALTVSQEYESKNLSMLNTNDGNPYKTGLPVSIDYYNKNSYDTLNNLAKTFVERVNQKVMEVPDSDEDVWAVRYEKQTGDFPVLVAACYATTEQDRYVGGYPVNTSSTGYSNYRSLSSDVSGWLSEASGS